MARRLLLLTTLVVAACTARSINLNVANFDAELAAANNKRLFVMFYAPWYSRRPRRSASVVSGLAGRCSHCKQTAPIWKSLSEEHQPNDVVIAKVDGTANQELLERFNVDEYPTVSSPLHSTLTDP